MPQLLEISGSIDPMAQLSAMTARAKIEASIPEPLRIALSSQKLDEQIARLRRASLMTGLRSLSKAFDAYREKDYRNALRRSITAVVNAAAAYQSDPELAVRIILAARTIARKAVAARR